MVPGGSRWFLQDPKTIDNIQKRQTIAGNPAGPKQSCRPKRNHSFIRSNVQVTVSVSVTTTNVIRAYQYNGVILGVNGAEWTPPACVSTDARLARNYDAPAPGSKRAQELGHTGGECNEAYYISPSEFFS